MQLLACERSGIRRRYSRRAPSSPTAAPKSQDDAKTRERYRGGATTSLGSEWTAADHEAPGRKTTTTGLPRPPQEAGPKSRSRIALCSLMTRR